MFGHKDLFLELTAFKATEARELTSRLSFTSITIHLLSFLSFFSRSLELLFPTSQC